jgi:putative hydrolase of the HAD superfamily
MIDAVLWDFGGVLTTSPFEAFNRYESERGIPRNFIRTINATNPDSNAWARFEASEVSLEEFDALFAAESGAAGHRIRGREVIDLLSGDLRPRMVEVLRHVKTRYRVGCITNNVKGGRGPGMANSAERAERMAEVMALFDLVVESSIEGIRKPNPRIYQIACERLAVEPGRTVFLDDLGINLKPAKALGMRTIKVLDEDQAIAELADILDLQLP